MENSWKSAHDGALRLVDERSPREGAGGELNAEIARAVVQIYRVALGRGPTRARSMFRGDVVLVILEDVLTPAERSLISDGRAEAALAMRRSLHSVMLPDLARAVAEATGCAVRAVLGDTNDDPDVAVEVFVLDRSVDPSRSAVPTR
jgi:uncharacterized protein YbcI